MKEYFIANNNEKQGPFSMDELKEKSVFPGTLVWEESFDDWKRADEIPEIANIIVSNLKSNTVKKETGSKAIQMDKEIAKGVANPKKSKDTLSNDTKNKLSQSSKNNPSFKNKSILVSILFVAICVFIISIFWNIKSSNWDYDGLSGKVESFEEKQYDNDNIEWIGGEYIIKNKSDFKSKRIRFYDKNGAFLSEEIYSGSDNLVEKTTPLYDEDKLVGIKKDRNGNINTFRFDFNSKKDYSYQVDYGDSYKKLTYDNNRLTEERRVWKSGINTIKSFSYNDEGWVKKVIISEVDNLKEPIDDDFYYHMSYRNIDRFGNWTQATVCKAVRPNPCKERILLIRKYDYFE